MAVLVKCKCFVGYGTTTVWYLNGASLQVDTKSLTDKSSITNQLKLVWSMIAIDDHVFQN